MTFRNRLQYLLVKKLQISNKAALELILEGKIKINGQTTFSNLEIEPEDEVRFGETLLQASQKFKTYIYYKPRGIETTLNLAITDNLKSVWPFDANFFPIGRLDKASEGLLIVSNDGRIYDKILRQENKIEKEYLVEVDKEITEDFISKMSGGIKIMGKTTLPCKVVKISKNTFQITLIQGINRQIRRMCYKLEYEVLKLKRTRIGTFTIADLKANEFIEIGAYKSEFITSPKIG